MKKSLKILIMGLQSWENNISKNLHNLLESVWINADQVRREANDWDFSAEGRERQAIRMKSLAEKYLKKTNM